MVDSSQINPDAEYRPKEEGYADIPQPLGMSQPQAVGRLKRIFIVLAIILVTFFAYNFFNWYSGQKRDVEDKKAPTVKQSQLAVLPTPIVVGKTSLTSETNDSAVRKQLDILSQEVESNREQLAELNNSLSQGQQVMENLNKNIAGLSAALKDIGDKVQQLASNTSKETKLVTKKAVKSNIIKKKIPVYHIKAIVPERVWLESDTGETVSVRVGDTLDGYGSVQAISPKQGIVVTSSTVIKYGSNDF